MSRFNRMDKQPKRLDSGLFVPGSYDRKVLNTQRSNLIAYWPLWESSGSVADNLEGTAARDGAYTGVTLGQAGIGDGRTCPLFDGSNDYVNIYSSSLNTATNTAEGSLLAWIKVSGAGVWTDATNRQMVRISVDGNNQILFRKGSTSNQLIYHYEASNTIETVTKTSVSTTDWFVVGITWSVNADEVKFYYDGAQEGSTQTSLGTWSGDLSSTGCIIGAQSTSPGQPFDGYIAHVAIWDTPLTAAQISDLATV